RQLRQRPGLFGHHVGRVRDAVAHVRGEAGGAQTGGRRRRAGPPRSEEERQPQEAPESAAAEGEAAKEILNLNYFPLSCKERVRVRGDIPFALRLSKGA